MDNKEPILVIFDTPIASTSVEYFSCFNDDIDESTLKIVDSIATFIIEERAFEIWSICTRKKIIPLPISVKPLCFSGKFGFEVQYTLNPINITDKLMECSKFFEKCVKEHVVIYETSTELYLFENEIYAMPWQIFAYTEFPEQFDDFPGTYDYWSSLIKDKPLSTEATKVFPYVMRTTPKTDTLICRSSTQIAYQMTLSDVSINKIHKYSLINKEDESQ